MYNTSSLRTMSKSSIWLYEVNDRLKEPYLLSGYILLLIFFEVMKLKRVPTQRCVIPQKHNLLCGLMLSCLQLMNII